MPKAIWIKFGTKHCSESIIQLVLAYSKVLQPSYKLPNNKMPNKSADRPFTASAVLIKMH